VTFIDVKPKTGIAQRIYEILKAESKFLTAGRIIEIMRSTHRNLTSDDKTIATTLSHYYIKTDLFKRSGGHGSFLYSANLDSEYAKKHRFGFNIQSKTKLIDILKDVFN